MNTNKASSDATYPAITYHIPTPPDGPRVHELIASCPPLDMNSVYCNVLQCTHFATTSVAAEMDQQMVGFISGYVIPDTNTLFIWQVAVHENARGMGVAKEMLRQLLQRESCAHVNAIETTISPSNAGSRALFASFAKELGTSIVEREDYFPETFFPEGHESEALFRIGPFK